MRKIGDLKPADYNPRFLSQAQEDALTASLKEFGFVDPLIVNKHKTRKDIVVGGHQRLKVAKKLKYDEVPTVEVSLTLKKERELNVRLNKNSGEFDMKLLMDFFDKDDLLDQAEISYFEVPIIDNSDLPDSRSNRTAPNGFYTIISLGSAASAMEKHKVEALVAHIDQMYEADEMRDKIYAFLDEIVLQYCGDVAAPEDFEPKGEVNATKVTT